jgi:hypothetical protein
MRVSIKLRRFVYNSHQNIVVVVVTIREPPTNQTSMYSLIRDIIEMQVQND